MIEYKFRGKRVDNGEWVYGGIEQSPHVTLVYDMELPYCNQVPVISETVGQYTGLHDKNGVEIYEGDLFICPEHHKPKKYEVTWSDDNERACFYAFNGDGTGFSPNDIEVIGNIHDKES